MTVELQTLVRYLDGYLQVDEIPDSSGALNGLQVESSRPISKVLAAVDACQASIDAAAECGAELLLVHHGMFWGGVQPVVGRQWKRLKTLIGKDIAVYSAHIPLDCHPQVGNNVLLARALGLSDLAPAGDYKGIRLGFVGSTKKTRSEFASIVQDVVGSAPHVIPGGPESVSCVCVITGGAGSMVEDAMACGADTFVTGEGSHHSFFDASEGGINLIYAGHYATETFGVKALAAHIREKFGVDWEFFDHPTGL